MEYPGTKFTRVARLAVLLIFIAAFFLIAPTVIMYSAGYRYDFRNGLLQETGSLSIDVLPKGTVAYLDGIKINGSMPIRLNSITPHKYSLRLSAPGYYDWEKQVEVDNNKTTYIKEIALLKNEKPKFLSKIKSDDLVLSGTGKYLAATTKTGQKTNVIMIDLQKNLAQIAMTFTGSEELTVTPAPESDYFAIKTDSSSESLYVIDAASLITHNISKVADEPIGKFLWNNQGTEPEIYFSTLHGIKSYLPRIDQTRVVTDKNYPDWFLENGLLWALSSNTTTGKINITRDVLGFSSIFSTLSPAPQETTSSLLDWKIDSTKLGVLVLHKGDQYKIVRPDKTYLLNSKNFSISKYNNWFIFWSPSELWTYTAGEEPFLLNRPGSELMDVQPLDQFNTLAFRWGNKITALFPYYFIERTLVVAGAKAMAVDSASKTLYYADKDGIWKLEY